LPDWAASACVGFVCFATKALLFSRVAYRFPGRSRVKPWAGSPAATDGEPCVMCFVDGGLADHPPTERAFCRIHDTGVRRNILVFRCRIMDLGLLALLALLLLQQA